MDKEFEVVSCKKIKHINIMLVEISYRTYHEHIDCEVFCVIRGSAKIRQSSSEFYVKEGSIAAFNSRAAHEIDAEGGRVTAVVLQYSPFFCREYYPHARRMMLENSDVTGQLSQVQNREMLNHICRMALNYFAVDRFFELRCIENMMHLLIMMADMLPCEYLNPEQYHSRVSKDYKIESIISYLETKYQFLIRLEDVAGIVGMTPAYLSHFFKNNIGISFYDYLNNLRFEHALRMIDRNLPLGDIASGSGFSDLKYMTKMFIKKTGVRPAEYRKRNQDIKNRERQRIVQETRQLIYSEEQSIELLEAYLKATAVL